MTLLGAGGYKEVLVSGADAFSPAPSATVTLTICTTVHILGRGDLSDDVEWDARKASANFKKHGVDFADAATVLHDEQAVTIREDAEGEERYVTIGMDALGNVLVLVYTWRGDRPRLISARKADPKEREQYGINS
jgi:uncharacterized DUF497 family protein